MAEDSSAITNVGYVTYVPHEQGDDRARPTAFLNAFVELGDCVILEAAFCSGKSLAKCLVGVQRKVRFLNNELVKIVSQEVGARRTAVAIVDPEEGASRPLFVHAILRFNNVEDDGDSVFIVVAYDSLVCVCSISPNDTIVICGAASGFVIWQASLA